MHIGISDSLGFQSYFQTILLFFSFQIKFLSLFPGLLYFLLFPYKFYNPLFSIIQIFYSVLFRVFLSIVDYFAFHFLFNLFVQVLGPFFPVYFIFYYFLINFIVHYFQIFLFGSISGFFSIVDYFAFTFYSI